LKGFGVKSQSEIKNAVEFYLSGKRFLHFYDAERIALAIFDKLKKFSGVLNISITGELRRCCDLVESIELILALQNNISFDDFKSLLQNAGFIVDSVSDSGITLKDESSHCVKLYITSEKEYYSKLFFTTGSEDHTGRILSDSNREYVLKTSFNSENEIYNFLKIQFCEPELREGLFEVEKAQNFTIPELIHYKNIRGTIHNHSTYSDGSSSLREMALECIRLGLEYLVICDHSKSAFYAGGMSAETVFRQHLEIDELNTELSPFRIFKGVESDILTDGSLDYPDDVLNHFEFIVASVHSGLKMSEPVATSRLIKAIENKFTSMLGHPTGRLLLSRPGYPIDHRKIIDACSANGVAVELNAHPYRLDLDWRWIGYAQEKGVLVSINPDAHHVTGISNMKFGVNSARKGMLTHERTLNAMGISDFLTWLNVQKAKR
jgi:DNA polymerase (family 10)